MVELREASWADIEAARTQSWAKAQRAKAFTRTLLRETDERTITTIDPRGREVPWGTREDFILPDPIVFTDHAGRTRALAEYLPQMAATYGVWLNMPPGFEGQPHRYWRKLHEGIDWFDEVPLVYQDRIYLAPAHNLVTNSGVHLSLQRIFMTTTHTHLTAVANSTNGGVRAGGVDNSGTAVGPTTSRFDTTGANRFITIFESNPTYSTANLRITATFNITNSDTTIIHKRYGQIGDGTTNGASGTPTNNVEFALLSMLSGFALDFGGNAYDEDVEARTDGAGS